MIGRTMRRLNEMLDKGIDGTFQESDYDETELSRLESKWKRFLTDSSIAKQNLEKEKANIKSMVSDISHQTKTPVANLRLYTELLRERLEKPCPQDEKSRERERILAREIAVQAEKLEFLMEALTKLSRLETGLVTVEPEKRSVEPLLCRVIAQIEPEAEKKGIRIVWDREKAKAAQARYDLKWSTELLCNLADNAVKYSEKGSQVEFYVNSYSMYTAICVKDQGRGISEEEIPRIFGRFYRGKDVQQQEGVGIGLYLAREIARQQEGYIRVRSRKGEGSVFQVYLPV